MYENNQVIKTKCHYNILVTGILKCSHHCFETKWKCRYVRNNNNINENKQEYDSSTISDNNDNNRRLQLSLK